jgi:hypothetical protein
VTNGTITGKVNCSQRVKHARKFSQTHRPWCRTIAVANPKIARYD